MIFYILLLLIVLVLFFFSSKYPNKEKNISLILLVIFVLIGGFRDRIGWDYNNYTNWYLNGTRDNGLEFGFLAIMKAFRYLNLDHKFLFFFFSFFTYLFAYLGIRKYTKKSSLPLVLYFLIPVLFLYSFTYMRQFLSVTISFYAFSFLLDKKYLKYFLLMGLATSIHYSCLIPLVVFLILFKWGQYIKIRYLYVVMGLSFIISQIGIIHLLSFFLRDSHYLFYVSSKFAIPVPLMKLLLLNVMGLIVLWYYDKYGFQLLHQKYLLLAYICSVIFVNIFSESSELTRIYIYFRIFEIVLVSEVIRSALVNKKLWLISFACCFYIFPFFRAIIIDSKEQPQKELKLVPYKSLLF
ncbi:EpsG family protein [Flavobacterium sp. LS1R47]|uniref:EpsG family protein n=1 Tax=Flavobacterium frigoritolerans TaxID=2987686 RepID=A0A9X2ZK90_9FLAO|nr:EpsG family protein [Flavobacterium frigoritolerans]MCV9931267.1 EpsG family protein [Flavobacterium frigoritolerans]